MTGDGRSSVLEVRDLRVSYGAVVAVAGVDLDLPAGRLTALVGPSGCGKTTLLRAVAGFEVPDRGSVAIDGRIVAGPGCWLDPEHRAVGMVFQQGALFPHMTVRANVAYGVRGRPDAESRVNEALALVAMSELGSRMPDQLSGGQQQRVALARALAPAPRLVLLDEPFANLDAELRRRVRQEVCAILSRSGTTALMVTHDQQEALSIADQLAVMGGGRILQTGSAAEIYDDPVSATVAEFIGEGQFVACSIRDGRLVSALGTARCVAPDGEGLLLVRPEDLELGDASAMGGAPGRIVGCDYRGYDQVLEVELDSGQRLRARTRGPTSPARGARAHVRPAQRRYVLYAAAGERRAIGHAVVADTEPHRR